MTNFRRHCHTLLFGHKWQRKNKLFLIGMKFRGFDLSGASLQSLGLSAERSFEYANSGGPCLDALLRKLQITEHDAALDIGCGKGGAMLTMANHPFAKVDGIEISPRLADIARGFLRRAGVRDASVFCCDAADFDDYDGYTFLYMYHPFPENVLKEVLQEILESARRHPRKLTLIYYNPYSHDLLIEAGFTKTGELDDGYLKYAVYTLSPRVEAARSSA